MLCLAPLLVRPPRLLIADEITLGLAPTIVEGILEHLRGSQSCWGHDPHGRGEGSERIGRPTTALPIARKDHQVGTDV